MDLERMRKAEEYLVMGLWLCEDQARVRRVCDALEAEFFLTDECREVFQAIKSSPDPLTPPEMSAKLSGGKTFKNHSELHTWLFKALSEHPAGRLGAVLFRNAAIVIEDWRTRRLEHILEKGLSEADSRMHREGCLERVQAALTDLARVRFEGEEGKTFVEQSLDVIDEWDSGLNRRFGVSTGIDLLDETVNRLKPGELIVVGARPGVGKSAFALNIVRSALDGGRKCQLFTLEMQAKEVAGRMVVIESGVPNVVARDKQRWGKGTSTLLMDAQTKLANYRFIVDDRSAVTVGGIEAAVMDARPELVVVDYLQLIKPENPRDHREQQVSECSRRLKQLAGEAQCPVLVMAQLNRQASDGAPHLKHLRESGAIEQDANVVIMLDRDLETDAGRRLMTAYVRKNRDGQTGTIELSYDPPTFRVSAPEVQGEF